MASVSASPLYCACPSSSAMPSLAYRSFSGLRQSSFGACLVGSSRSLVLAKKSRAASGVWHGSSARKLVVVCALMERCGAAAAASSSACNAGKIVSQGKQRRRSHVVGARNVSPGKKNTTVVPSQPEMTPEELAEYEKLVSQLDGKQPDFWEGEQWNWLGFVLQYLWVFGFVVSIIACLVAVRTYNLGATDFKNTEVFKEALESQSSDFGESFSEIEDAPSVVQE
ncbi:unnamed protein product [Sphagnum jensenii]|uniref:Uncharacterized protein n=1 Tax=Sphagnum jensenii TaxID=128206 RepID=A0ABP0WPU1_9BRYO